MDYKPDHWFNLVAWGRGVVPVRSGRVKWVNTMSVVNGGAWVNDDG